MPTRSSSRRTLMEYWIVAVPRSARLAISSLVLPVQMRLRKDGSCARMESSDLVVRSVQFGHLEKLDLRLREIFVGQP